MVVAVVKDGSGCSDGGGGGGIVNGDGGGGVNFCLFVCFGGVARIPIIHRFSIGPSGWI